MKNEPCPKCGSTNTWRITHVVEESTYTGRGGILSRTHEHDRYLMCDDCKHKWSDEK